MGYLTAVTIYNDGLDLLKTHRPEFCAKLYQAALSMEPQEFGVGFFCNFANVQRTRHADDHALYVHMGNTLTEINPFSREFEHMIKTQPYLADKYIRFLEDTVQDIKRHIASGISAGQG
jgi:hypothetical protein